MELAGHKIQLTSINVLRITTGRYAPLPLAEEQGALPHRKPRQALVHVTGGYVRAGQGHGWEGTGP